MDERAVYCPFAFLVLRTRTISLKFQPAFPPSLSTTPWSTLSSSVPFLSLFLALALAPPFSLFLRVYACASFSLYLPRSLLYTSICPSREHCTTPFFSFLFSATVFSCFIRELVKATATPGFLVGYHAVAFEPDNHRTA